MGVGVNCQGNAVNAGECQRNEWERVYSAKVQGEYRGMQGKARGTHGSGCKVPGECRGMPRERMGDCAKCQGNVRGMLGELMGVGAKCQRNAKKGQGNVRELVQ